MPAPCVCLCCPAGVSPGIVKQIIPLLEQLTPIYLDIANGAQVGCSSATARCACMHRGATALLAQTVPMRVHAPLLWCSSHFNSAPRTVFCCRSLRRRQRRAGPSSGKVRPRGTEVGGCSCVACTLHSRTVACPPAGCTGALHYPLPLPSIKKRRPPAEGGSTSCTPRRLEQLFSLRSRLPPPPLAGYTVPRNLLLRFAQDEIDETPQLASTLQSSGGLLTRKSILIGLYERVWLASLLL